MSSHILEGSDPNNTNLQKSLTPVLARPRVVFMRAVVSRFVVVFVLLPLLIAGCSSGGNGGTGPGGNDGSISISVTPGTLTVQEGGDGQVTVTLTRSGGFAGVVTLNASGVPSGSPFRAVL